MSLWRFIKNLFSSADSHADASPSQPLAVVANKPAPTPAPDRAFCAITDEIAQRAGLQPTDPSAPWHDAPMKAQRDGLNVAVRLRYAAAANGEAHALEVLIQGAIPKRLSLQCRHALSFDDPMGQGPRRRPPEGVSIGDVPFDTAFNLYCLDRVCAAALSRDVCGLLVALAQVAEVRVADGEVLVRQRIPTLGACERVINTIHVSLTIAKAFSAVLWIDDTLPLSSRLSFAIDAGERAWAILEAVALGEWTPPLSSEDRAASLRVLCKSLPASRWRALLTALAKLPYDPNSPEFLMQIRTIAQARPIPKRSPNEMSLWFSPLHDPDVDDILLSNGDSDVLAALAALNAANSADRSGHIHNNIHTQDTILAALNATNHALMSADNDAPDDSDSPADRDAPADITLHSILNTANHALMSADQRQQPATHKPTQPPAKKHHFLTTTSEIAQRADLQPTERNAPWHDVRMKALRDGFILSVRLRCEASVSDSDDTLDVSIQGLIPKQLSLQSRSLPPSDDPIGKGPPRRPPEGVSIGDVPFDKAFNLSSLHPVCTAALSKRVCALLVALAQVAEVRVADAEMLVQQRIPNDNAVERILNTVEVAFTIAKGFSAALWIDDTLPLSSRLPSAIDAGESAWAMLEVIALGEWTPPPSSEDRAAALRALHQTLPNSRWLALISALLTELAEPPHHADTPYLLTQALTAARLRPVSGLLPSLITVWHSPLCAPHINLIAFKDAATAQPATPEQAAALAHLLTQNRSAYFAGTLALIDTPAAGGLAIASDPHGPQR